MIGLLFPLVAAAAATQPVPPAPPVQTGGTSGPFIPSLPVPDGARAVMLAQLQSAPRTDGSGGLTPPEADAVTTRANGMIGQKLDTGTQGSQGSQQYGQPGSHP